MCAVRGCDAHGWPAAQPVFTPACALPRPSCPPAAQDIHSAGTTVREALVFSARLRLAEDIGWEQVQRTVDSTLAVTDLTALAGAIVGEPGARWGGQEEEEGPGCTEEALLRLNTVLTWVRRRCVCPAQAARGCRWSSASG